MLFDPMEIVAFVIGLVAGVAAGAFLLTRRAVAAEQRAARAEEAREAAESHARELLERERQAADEKLRLVTASREQLAEQMKAISSGVLKDTSAQLAQLVEQARRADRETHAARAEEIRKTLAPVAEHLRKVEQEVQQLERARNKTHGTVEQMFRAVTEEVSRLRAETGTLVSALKRPQVRGSWGEMQLRNCVEAANMTAHVDFHTQRSLDAGDDGRLRPDMTVHLPAGRTVIVDSKVPLDAYLAALECGDGAQREAELDRHARQVRAHLDTLASKSYHAQLEGSPEFVVCFIPNEAIYCAALDRDPSLLEHGANRGVLIATPTSLMALLHAVYYGWRQETIEASAREIADAARELHKRAAKFLEPFAKLGRQLDSATNAYNQAVGSLEGRVLPQLRRIEEAGAASERTLQAPRPLDTPARLVTAPELQPSGDEPAGPPALPERDAA